MSASRHLLYCWLALAVLCVASVWLGDLGASGWLALALWLVALGKAWLITEGFMELRHAPPLWRWLLFGWPLVTAAGVLLTLLIQAGA
jgi:hypothetical protein